MEGCGLVELAEQIWPAMVLALGVSAVLLKSLRRPARLLGLVDVPGGRKAHDHPTPTIGGIAVLVAFGFALFTLVPDSIQTLFPGSGPTVESATDLNVDSKPAPNPGPNADSTPSTDTTSLSVLQPAFWLGVMLLALAGVIDDARGLKSLPKFVIQGVAAGVVVLWGGLQLKTLGSLPSGAAIALGAAAIPFTWFAIVGFVNATNMLDGVDGLAGGVLVVMLLWLAYAGSLAGAVLPAQAALVLAAALIGFLVHNMRSPFRRRASVFLGDTGSLALGFVVACLAIAISQAPGRVISPIGLAWVVVLPVMDTVSLMTRRLIRGQNPFHADRNHLHHILGRAGFTPGQSAGLLSLLTIVLGGIGVFGSLNGVPDVVLGILLVALAIGHYLFVRYAWRSTRAIKRLRAQRPPLTASEQVGLAGLFITVGAVPFSALALIIGGYGLVVIATLANARLVAAEVLRTRLSWAVLALAGWVSLAVIFGPQPSLQGWWPVVAASGLLALPLGWWFERLRFYAVALFAVLVASTLFAFGAEVEWPMLEAGFLRVSDYWGRPTADGLLLALVIMPLLVGAASGLAAFLQHWRARALAVISLVLLTVFVLLLLGTGARIALAATLAGLLVLVLAAAAHGVGQRLWVGIAGGAVVLVLATSLLANAFKPPGLSLTQAYWGPVQSALLYTAGEQQLARDRYPDVVVRLDAWRDTWQAVGVRPLAGWGVLSTSQAAAAAAGTPSLAEAPPAADASPSDNPPQTSASAGPHRSAAAYAVLALAGGWTALGLFLLVIGGGCMAVARAGHRRHWPIAHALASHGALGAVAAFLMFSPLVTTVEGVALLNGVLALGIAAAVGTARGAEQDRWGGPGRGGWIPQSP
jgi:UDP-GlcNAc:undecaprenyl-phosphate GlcNAc-1-phosphate transferase